MKYPDVCIKGKKKLSFHDCELAILRSAIDKVQARTGRKMLHSKEVKRIIAIVENFLRTKKRVCYGGTAINNILPEDLRFYNNAIELPDYDFFSPDALNDAKSLADIYVKEGFTEVEAKAGVHGGTFKVFVNFIPVADITFVPKELYNMIFRRSISIDGLHYSPPDYLRMLMYLELSRPMGDTDRWEKVLKRLILLNRVYPLKGKNCESIEVQRMFDKSDGVENTIYYLVRNTLINEGVIFFGGFANRMYLRHHQKFSKKKIVRTPDFDVLSKNPKRTATIIHERLRDAAITNIKVVERDEVGEIIAKSYEVQADGETLVAIYKPMGCHSYNVIHRFNRKIRVATIDTMLSFYLAFLYANRPYYDPDRLLCMSEYLFEVQKENRLKQKGILRRFSIDCYGKQTTLTEMRQEKAEKYKELKNKKGSKEYDYYFLRYTPGEIGKSKKKTRKRKHRYKKKKKTQKRRSVVAGLLGI